MANLNLLSQVGVILFMFAVGMELDLQALRGRAKVALFVSHTGIVLPFFLGAGAALFLFPELAGPRVGFVAFALFMGIAMSITAFPVLARILEERGLNGTPLGSVALTSAAVDDVTAWTLLAVVVAVARAQSPWSSAGMALAGAAFALFMLGAIKPAGTRLMARLPDPSHPGKGASALILIVVFLSAFATEAIGLHSLFGAFLAGLAMPQDRAFRGFLRERLEYSAGLYLLPIFFASTGLRTRIGLLEGGMDWLICGGLLLLAVAGKLGGGCLAARLSGMGWRDSVALGVLMNTRGLMELIVLNIGLDLGILSPRVFTMMVLVALVTTAMTGPLLTALGIGRGSVGQSHGRG